MARARDFTGSIRYVVAVGAIEEIILSGDKRGISALRPLLPDDFCADAARYVLDHPGTTLIATGFYILSAQAVETDGPPGAAAIGRALEALGTRVVYVTDLHGAGVVRAAVGPAAEVIEFPLADVRASEEAADAMLAEYAPALLVGIERCAPSDDGVYRNMRSIDITPHTARTDTLFERHEASVGIGDGGNEIGMGMFAPEIAASAQLPDQPAVTRTAKLVIASVSNWGAYGLVAAMSLLVGRNLLLDVEEEERLVRACVEAGAVDGFSGERVERVDGFELPEYSKTLAALHAHLTDEGVR